jgi:GT2 family glycosyltransferase
VSKTKIDIIILSNARDDKLKGLTEQSITTLLASEDPKRISFDVLVIESNKDVSPYKYPEVKTVYPESSFGYNKYMNIGIKATHNDYICLCNNDLVFHKGWANAILDAMDSDPGMMSASPYCPIFHKNAGFDGKGPVREGYFGVLGGWCIFMKRKIFDIIGLFDEKLIFWYCDADYCKTLEKFEVKNCLVPASKVTHLGSESLKTVDEKEYRKLTQAPRIYYSYKWDHHSYPKYAAQKILLKLKLIASTKSK